MDYDPDSNRPSLFAYITGLLATGRLVFCVTKLRLLSEKVEGFSSLLPRNYKSAIGF